VRPARKADVLTAIYELIVWKMWESRRLTPLGPPLLVTRVTVLLIHCSWFMPRVALCSERNGVAVRFLRNFIGFPLLIVIPSLH
jgi:hypothetical protein